MIDHTRLVPFVRALIHGLPLGLSLELWIGNGELSGALWLFCLCEAYAGEA